MVFVRVTSWCLLKRGTTWNNLKRLTASKKRPETTYNKQETTWNDLQCVRNNLKRSTTSKKQLETTPTSKTQPTMIWTYLQRAKKRRETTNNKQIFRLFYNMGKRFSSLTCFPPNVVYSVLKSRVCQNVCSLFPRQIIYFCNRKISWFKSKIFMVCQSFDIILKSCLEFSEYTDLEIQFRSSYYTIFARIWKILSKSFSLEGSVKKIVVVTSCIATAFIMEITIVL